MAKCPDCGKRELKDGEKLCPSCLTKRDTTKKKVATGIAGVLVAIAVFIIKGGKK